MLIKELIDNGNAVTLFTRPRRFGKTLNMSMLKRYFERTDEDNSYLFDRLKISGAGEKYHKYMGQYPVISISISITVVKNLKVCYNKNGDGKSNT